MRLNLIRFLVWSILCVVACCANAQELSVVDFREVPMDLSASTNMRRDANNEPCALIKVALRAEGASFEGNIVGNTEFRTNEYWVYMTKGTKMLRIKHISAKPLMVRFENYGIDGLKPQMTYELDITLPVASAGQQIFQMVMLSLEPADAEAVINGEKVRVVNGTGMATLAAEKKYEYVVSKRGYVSQQGSFYLEPTSPKQLSVVLQKEKTQTITPPLKPDPVVSQNGVVNPATQNPIGGVGYKTGKLPNGLTYFVKPNGTKSGFANFYLVQKSGSLQEEDNQRGLTHFLEHMMFNGTEHFPGNSLIEWSDKKGIKFGKNLNAYTTPDYAEYMLTDVPVGGYGITDSCLLVLHDWAGGLTLADDAIEAERNVIAEERRAFEGNTQQLLLDKVYQGSRYADRKVMGSPEVVRSVKPDVLRNFYKSWFRPELQCVIVVGDVDPEQIEQKITTMFSDLKNPVGAPARVSYQMDDNPETLFAVNEDSKLSRNEIYILKKYDAVPNDVKPEVRITSDYVIGIINIMLDARLRKMAQQNGSLFDVAACQFMESIGYMKNSTCAIGYFKQNMGEQAFRAMYGEISNIIKNGFTEEEYKSAKADYRKSLDEFYENRNSLPSESYARKFTDCFVVNKPIIDDEMMYNVVVQTMEQIPITAVNSAASDLMSGEENRVVMVSGTSKIPDEVALKAIIREVDAK